MYKILPTVLYILHVKIQEKSKQKKPRTPESTKGKKEGEAQTKEQQLEREKKEQEKKEKAMLESWLDRQAHELKYGEAARVIQEIERLKLEPGAQEAPDLDFIVYHQDDGRWFSHRDLPRVGQHRAGAASGWTLWSLALFPN